MFSIAQVEIVYDDLTDIQGNTIKGNIPSNVSTIMLTR